MRRFAYTLSLCLLATSGFAHDGDEDAPKPAQSIEELGQQLEKILKETHTPGMSVAIVHRDGPEWVAGLGKADVRGDRAASPETLFRIGSTSKAFVSLSILKLVNEGKLKQVIRGRVRKYSMVVIPALLVAAAHLGYWGLIGLRTWA